MKDFSYEAKERIAVISRSADGKNTLELNRISYSGRPAKLDLRRWSREPGEEPRMHKGITLTDEEAAELLESVGQHEPGLHSLAKAGFATLGLQADRELSHAVSLSVGMGVPHWRGTRHRIRHRRGDRATPMHRRLICHANHRQGGAPTRARADAKAAVHGGVSDDLR